MKKRTPHILVVLRNPERESNAIRHGLELARIFHSHLALAVLSHDKNDSAQQKLETAEALANQFQNETKIPVNFIAWDYGKTNLNLTIQQLEVFYLVLQMDKKRGVQGIRHRSTLAFMRKAKVPSIVVQKDTPIDGCYSRIFLPVDFRKVSKEKMIWGSYFGRFHNARLYLVAANERSQEMIRRINSTLIFTKKMFQQFAFEYEILSGKSSSSGIERETLELAQKKNAGLVIIMASTHQHFIDLLRGPSEIKAILNKEKLPVMCINPLKDYYLPCN